jgi:capsular exopolysaccharide synthesis family protein
MTTERVQERRMAEKSSEPEGRADARAGKEREVLVLVHRSVDQHLVMYHEPQSGLAEQYRTFRTNLVAMNASGQPRALAVTSAVRGEGKSLTIANLALALAELPDTRVLIVDADLRAPRQAQLFGLAREPGLSDLMLDFAPLEKVVVRTTVPGLSLLPAGRPVKNPSELLGSARMGDLVSALKAGYHYVLFDTPPSLPFADAAVLGHRLDGLLFVLRMEKTPRDQASRALELLRNAGNNVLGTFLAGTRSDDGVARDYVIRDED